jgi:hypothetical protein
MMTATLPRRLALLSVIGVGGLPNLQAQGLKTLTAITRESVAETRLCGGSPVLQPKSLPTSGPVVFLIEICFEPVGYQSRFPPEKYVQLIHLRPSRPTQGEWTLFDESAERAIFEDYRRLWDDGALTDISISVHDYRFTNGVIGKIVSYHLTERPSP